MPYQIPKSAGGDTKKNIAKMERCVKETMQSDPNLSESEAIAICKDTLFAEKVKANEADAVAFADDIGVSKETAEKIINVLYDKDVSVDYISRVIDKLKMQIADQAIKEKLNNSSKEDIEKIVDDMLTAKVERVDEITETQNYDENDVSLWFFEELEFADKVTTKDKFKAGDKVKIQIMRTGEWNHPAYGKIKVTKKMLSDVIKNFKNKKRGIDLAVDENHEPNHRALGWFRDLEMKGDNAVNATIELTRKGAELLTDGAYKYFSPEIAFKKQDEETGKTLRNLLIGGAFTNRPFFKAMKPLMASETASDHHQNGNHSILFFNSKGKMKKLFELIGTLAEKEKLSAKDKQDLQAAFDELPQDERENEEMKQAFNEIMEKAEFEGEDEDDQESDKSGGDASDDDEGNDGESDEGDDNQSGDDEGSDESSDDDQNDKSGDDEGSDEGDDQDGTQANEDTVSIKASELEKYKNDQKRLSKLIREQKEKKLSERLDGVVFSEQNGSGIMLPKQKQKVLKFAANLSDNQAEQFCEIMEDLQKVSAQEIGSGGNESSEEAKIESKFSEVISQYTGKLGYSKDEAVQIIKQSPEFEV